MSRSCKKNARQQRPMQKFQMGKARGKQEGSTGENTVGKSKAFRKISETWDICDWKFYGERPWNPNREEKNQWGKCYYRK